MFFLRFRKFWILDSNVNYFKIGPRYLFGMNQKAEKAKLHQIEKAIRA